MMIMKMNGSPISCIWFDAFMKISWSDAWCLCFWQWSNSVDAWCVCAIAWKKWVRTQPAGGKKRGAIRWHSKKVPWQWVWYPLRKINLKLPKKLELWNIVFPFQQGSCSGFNGLFSEVSCWLFISGVGVAFDFDGLWKLCDLFSPLCTFEQGRWIGCYSAEHKYGTWKSHLWNGTCSSKPSFLGSMLTFRFWGVNVCERHIRRLWLVACNFLFKSEWDSFGFFPTKENKETITKHIHEVRFPLVIHPQK